MQIFRMIDRSNDEVLSSKEISQAFTDANGRETEPHRFFLAMDIDNDGEVTLTEYIEFWTQVRQSGVSEKAVL